MLSKLKQRKESGFTIIEVMIVLAIAGLIMIVVFLAVPALQRNSRNSALRSDVGAISGGVAEYASNNDGGLPTATGSSCATGSVSLGAGTVAAPVGTPSTPKVQGGTKVTCTSTIAAVTPAAGEITVMFGAKCPATVSGVSVTPVVSSRSTAIVYANETGSAALQAKCTDS